MSRLFYLFSRLLNRRPIQVYSSHIDKLAAVGNGAQIYNSTIERYSYVFNSKLIHTKVGAFCSIAEDCVIGGGAHPTDWVSSSPVFYAGRNSLHKNYSNNKFKEFNTTIIGNDVWIGSKCIIKSGVHIGDGAIVGMGSVVLQDIPPYEIWGGNPARLIRKRFEDDIISELLNIQWWNWDEEQLNNLGEYFDSPSELINRINKQ